jgi:hypothetical protein
MPSICVSHPPGAIMPTITGREPGSRPGAQLMSEGKDFGKNTFPTLQQIIAEGSCYHAVASFATSC